MNYALKLSLKNLFRHKLRTAVTIAAVAVAVTVVVFARGWVNGIIEGFSEAYTHYSIGHIRIIDREYRARERLLTLLHPVDGFEGEGAGPMITELEKMQGVEHVLPRIKFGAMAATEDELVDMAGWAVDAEKEKSFTRIETKITEGRMPSAGERKVLMGGKLLKRLGIGVGEKITIVYSTAYGSLGGTTFEVSGRIESGLKMLNEKVFYLPIDVARELLYMEDQATEIIIGLSSMEKAREVMPEVEAFLEEQGGSGRYKPIPWYNSGTLVESISLMRYVYGFIYLFLVLLACFVIANTMIMIVSERKKEIGMMGALGMEKKSILRIFLLEGVIKGAAGSFAGALLGGALTLHLSSAGIDLGDALAEMSQEVFYSQVIYPVFSVSNMIFGFLLGVILVALAGYLPARKAAGLKPTEALREG